MANQYYLTIVYENLTSSNASSEETCENLSQETLDYLNDLNQEVTLNTIPLQLFYVILIVMGIVGNILVIYIYGRKLQKTSAVQLILRLAYIDLFSCIVVIPFNFTEIYIKFTFTYVDLCKAFEYTRASAEALSCLTLTYIAVDRYFAICKPLSFAMHSQKAKLVLYSTVVLAFLLMLPALFMYGTRTVQFDNGLIGCTCYIRDLYYLTEWHVLFRTFQFLLNLTLFVIISLLYISVYKTVHKRIRAPSNPSLHSPQTVAPPKGLFRQRSSKRRKVSPAPDNVPSIRIDAGDTRKKPSVSSVSSVELNIQIREICKNKEAKEKGSRRRRRRNDSSRNFLGLAILCGGCIPCKEAKRRESVTPMVHSISRAESTSSQDDRNHSVASAPASMCHDYECEDMHLEPSPIKKISDSVLTKQMDSASARQLQEMSTLNLFTAKKVGQTSERGNGEKENNIHEEEDSLASPKLKNKRNSDFVEHTNAIKMGDDNSSKRSPRSKNKFNLTLPSADRHSIYQAGMMVGKMRRISLPATYRQNSTEETKAYLSEAALNQYQKTRYKTAMILLTVTVVFLLTWTPFWILHVVVYVDNDFWDNQTYTEQNIFRMLRYMYMINHAINPVIYAFAHKQFRDDMKTVFKKICCRSRY